MIEVVKENFKSDYLEDCVSCGDETDYWYPQKNQPVCQTCAKTVNDSDIPKCHRNYKFNEKDWS